MYRLTPLLALLILASSLAASAPEVPHISVQPSSIARLEYLMDITARNLKLQEALKQALIDYGEAQNGLMDKPRSKKHARAMIDAAVRIAEGIEKTNVAYLFSPDFLRELATVRSHGKRA